MGFRLRDYEDAGEKSMLHMSGQAAPGTRVALYIDNQFAGMATADATGSWSFSGNKRLTGGKSHFARRSHRKRNDEGNRARRSEIRPDGAHRHRTCAMKTIPTRGADNGASAGVRALPRQATASTEPDATLTDRNGAVITVRSGTHCGRSRSATMATEAKYTQIQKQPQADPRSELDLSEPAPSSCRSSLPRVGLRGAVQQP